MTMRSGNHDIKMHHLAYFIQAATSGSLVNAAEILRVSQPAVSKAIADLESILGVPLFLRRPTGIELTGYGEVFLRHALDARTKITEAVASVEDMKNKKRGHVRVGVIPMDAVPFFHDGVMGLKDRRPNIVVSILTGSNQRLLPDLLNGSLDFVIGRSGDPSMMSDLIHEPLFGERMALVVWPSNVHAQRDKLELSELVDTPWLVPLPNTVIRERLNEEFTKQKLEFPSDYVEGGVSMVLGTMPDCPEPVVVCPHSFVAQRIAAGELIELDVPIDKELAPTGITRRKSARLSQSASLFIEELQRAGAEHRKKRPIDGMLRRRPESVAI